MEGGPEITVFSGGHAIHNGPSTDAITALGNIRFLFDNRLILVQKIAL